MPDDHMPHAGMFKEIPPEKEQEIHEEAVKQWGVKSQIDMAAEESAELIKKLMKFGRVHNGATILEITEEMADVEVMLAQLKVVFKNKGGVALLKKVKLEKLMDMLGVDG